MSEQSIRALIAVLEQAGGLARVRRRVDPARDMAAVGLKVRQERGQATLFEDAAGARAATQLLAGRGQWAQALGVAAADLPGFVARGLRGGPPPAAVAPESAPVAAMRRTGGALGLERWPMPRAGEDDAAGQMAAVAIAIDPASGRACLALTRHHLAAPGRLGVIGMSPAMATLLAAHHAHGTAMPMALVVGAHPALILAAALGTWRGADLALAGSLAGAPIRVLRDAAIGVPVPADAELVIAGAIAPGDGVALPHLTTMFGTAAAGGTVPALAAATVLERADPIFHAMHPGAPGDVAGTLCLATEALVAEHIRNIEGGIDFIDITCPPAACGQVVVVKLRGRVEGQTKTALLGALSGPANWLKLAIAVDEDVDAGDLRDVFWSVASRTHAEIDVGMIDGLRAHAMDLAAPLAAGGGRMATRWFIDSSMPPLTQPKRREDFARAIPKNLDDTDLARFLPKPLTPPP